MLDEKPAQLVAHLSHPNGWWRDTAQKLLVLKGDKSVVPALTELVRKGISPLGRVHALWTLDGLGAIERTLIMEAFNDADERVRGTALRISEAYLKKGDAEVVAKLQPLLQDTSKDVVVQAINSLRYVPAKGAHSLIQTTAAAHIGNEIITASAEQSLKFDPLRPSQIGVKIDPVGMALIRDGRDHFVQICSACHGPDGKGVVTSDGLHLAPPLAGSPRVLGSPAALVRIVLHGLIGEVDGKTYPGLMVPQKANDDVWIAGVLTYIRNSFGNSAPTITPQQIATIRAASGDHAPFTMDELAPFLTIPAQVTGKWVFTASDNEKGIKLALDGDPKTRWSTNKVQQEGQWLQVDMGKPFQLTSLVLDATSSKDDYPRRYEVRTSADGEHWSDPVASGKGATITTIEFPTKSAARYIRITQTSADKGCFWSINELGIYGSAAQ
jgi:mono/diheme cytochrome c family protein